ncbi:MAG: hypothetical protein ACPG78_03875 [Gammaproteobacteria bacterium]
MYKLILILLLSINISSNDLVLSFNQLINNNLSFIQTTDTGAEEVESIGQIYKKEDAIEIIIDLPNREKYTIRDSLIEIYDYEFDQTQIIEINDDNSFLIDFLNNKFDFDDIQLLDKNSFIVFKNNKEFTISIISESTFSIIYKDNMDYKNSILFTTL